MNRKNKIEQTLRNVLLGDQKMNYDLYKYELEEFIEECKATAIKDKDEYTYVITENNGDVAMFLITKENELYINEQALEKLKQLWHKAYIYNIEFHLPIMVEHIYRGYFAVNGITFKNTSDK